MDLIQQGKQPKYNGGTICLLQRFQGGFINWRDWGFYCGELLCGLFGLKEMTLSLIMSDDITRRFKKLFKTTSSNMVN
jgi:hypothetical protein